MTATARRGDRAAVADARLEREYHARHRRLVAFARRRYRLSLQDCEEVANDTLIAWHRELRKHGQLGCEDAFCKQVLGFEAIDRLRRGRRLQMVPFSAVENTGVDPRLDAVIVDREHARELHRLAREILDVREWQLVRLVCVERLSRTAAAELLGLRPLEVKRILARARRKLRAARLMLESDGQCQILAAAIAGLRAGRVPLCDPRWRAAVRHAAGCPDCATAADDSHRQALRTVR